MSTPLVSVALPIYNGGSMLAAALDSLLAQTHRDFEVLAVDDGSSDDTPAVLGRYAEQDARIVVMRTPNRGIVAALNTAIAHARGRYIARMDADDICNPQRFERQVAHLEAFTGCVAVGSEVTLIDAEAQPLAKQPGLARSYRLKDRCRGFSKFPPSPPSLAHPTAMIRTSSLKQAGAYRRYFKCGAEDRDLWWRLMPLGEIHRLPERLLRYRMHPSNRSVALRTGAVADAVVSDFSAIARHFELRDLPILEDYDAARLPLTVERYAELVGDRYPIRALALYRAITRKVPSLLERQAISDLRRDALQFLWGHPFLKASWRMAWAAMR